MSDINALAPDDPIPHGEVDAKSKRALRYLGHGSMIAISGSGGNRLYAMIASTSFRIEVASALERIRAVRVRGNNREGIPVTALV
jgi:hypothetical protein